MAEKLIEETLNAILIIANYEVTLNSNQRKAAEHFLLDLFSRKDVNILAIVHELLKLASTNTYIGDFNDIYRRFSIILKDNSIGESIQFISLSLLDSAITLEKWEYLNTDQKQYFKKGIIELALSGYNDLNKQPLISYSVAVRRLSCILSKIAIAEWPDNWPDFLTEICACRTFILQELLHRLHTLEFKINLKYKVSIISKLILGIVKEIAETITSTTISLQSKRRATVISGICCNGNTILEILSDTLQAALLGDDCLLDDNTKQIDGSLLIAKNCDFSLTQLALECLKHIISMTDIKALLEFKLDHLLLELFKKWRDKLEEEIIDLFSCIIYNISKQKHKRTIISTLEYEDTNRLIMGIVYLVNNVVLIPDISIPNYETYEKHLAIVNLFKITIEKCIGTISQIPDNMYADNTNSKFNTIICIWRTCILLSIHPSLNISNIGLLTVTIFLKHYIINKFSDLEATKFYKYFDELHVEVLFVDRLFVILFIRALRIGDPAIKYKSEHWTTWNKLLSTITLTTISPLYMNVDFENKCLENKILPLIQHISKYIQLTDEYNIGGYEDKTGINFSTFSNTYSKIRSQVQNILNILVDWDEGRLLSVTFETFIRLATMILSNNSFNLVCNPHTFQFNKNPNNLSDLVKDDKIHYDCPKWVILDSLFFIVETLTQRIYKNTAINPLKTVCTSLEHRVSSYYDVNMDTVKRKESRWIQLLHQLLNGFLQLPLDTLCGIYLEYRKISLIQQTFFTIPWFDSLSDKNSVVTPNGFLKMLFLHLSSTKFCTESKNNHFQMNHTTLKKHTVTTLTKIMLNSQIFDPYINEIIQTVKNCLLDSGITYEEKSIFIASLSAAVCSTKNYKIISELISAFIQQEINFLLNPFFKHCSKTEFAYFLFGPILKYINTIINDKNNQTREFQESSDKIFNNLNELRNSLNIILTVLSHIQTPDNFDIAKNGGFLIDINETLGNLPIESIYSKKYRNFNKDLDTSSTKFQLFHPLEPIMAQIFENLFILCKNLFDILKIGEEDEIYEYFYLFVNMCDSEWNYLTLNKDINYKTLQNCFSRQFMSDICYEEVNEVRHLLFTIRKLLIKTISSIITLGTNKKIKISEMANEPPCVENEAFNSNITSELSFTGFYFYPNITSLLSNSLIEPIEQLPIYVILSLVKLGWTPILSPNNIPKKFSSRILQFLTEVFAVRFIPTMLKKFEVEWNNIEYSHAYIILQTNSLLKDNPQESLKVINQMVQKEKPLLNTPLELFFGRNNLYIEDSNINNVVYMIHYHQLNLTIKAILQIVEQFLTTKSVHNLNLSFEQKDYLINPLHSDVIDNNYTDVEMDEKLMTMDSTKRIQFMETPEIKCEQGDISKIVFQDETIVLACLNTILKTIHYPEASLIEYSFKILNKYVRQFNAQYINLKSGSNILSKFEFHLTYIKQLLLSLLQIGLQPFSFDPLNMTSNLLQPEIYIHTPLKSHMENRHFILLRSAISELIKCIIRSTPICNDYIIKERIILKDQEGKSEDYNSSIISIPEVVLSKGVESLNLLISSANLFTVQETANLVQSVLLEFILDTPNNNSVLNTLIYELICKQHKLIMTKSSPNSLTINIPSINFLNRNCLNSNYRENRQ
ncbi:hypothetical protein cand_003360 [Cryptosporidium andersoni]|uniref:Exportin-1/Importin-beta-like domain-containing protein n=1 Tax=Cryptosporidium andersoni TaxID=117008 RepID=A0A1J4MHM3_9CRYT|nr:hypothetical protein cand_003360 [Cryptosporidium andersoni]